MLQLRSPKWSQFIFLHWRQPQLNQYAIEICYGYLRRSSNLYPNRISPLVKIDDHTDFSF